MPRGWHAWARLLKTAQQVASHPEAWARYGNALSPEIRRHITPDTISNLVVVKGEDGTFKAGLILKGPGGKSFKSGAVWCQPFPTKAAAEMQAGLLLVAGLCRPNFEDTLGYAVEQLIVASADGSPHHPGDHSLRFHSMELSTAERPSGRINWQDESGAIVRVDRYSEPDT